MIVLHLYSDTGLIPPESSVLGLHLCRW